MYAGLLSAVEPSCIYLANRGPFDRLRDPMDRLRDPMTLRLEATLPFQGSYEAIEVTIYKIDFFIKLVFRFFIIIFI